MKYFKELEDAMYKQQYSAKQRIIKGIADVDKNILESIKQPVQNPTRRNIDAVTIKSSSPKQYKVDYGKF